MSKKQQKKTTSKKTRQKTKTAGSATANKAAGAKRGRMSATAVAASPGGAALADPRLPATGTVIYKRDRYGAVRCECTVEEAGIRYDGNVYRSLSAAAMAAAKDLRLTNKTQNGYTFWGLSKPPGKTADPVTVIKHASEVFERKAKAAIAGRVTNENRAAINGALLKHAEKLEAMRGPVDA